MDANANHATITWPAYLDRSTARQRSSFITVASVTFGFSFPSLTLESFNEPA
jgi:hypothetical protein